MRIEVLDAVTATPFIIPHYHRNDFAYVEIHTTECLFVATNGLPEVLGCVRYCVEEDVPLLRSMVVDKPYQGRGIGNKLLRHFEEYLQSKNIQNTHLVCSSRLNGFYNQIGFKKIDLADTPKFLLERIRERDPDFVKMNCMCRP